MSVTSSLTARLTSDDDDGRVAGRIRIELTDDELEDVEEIARARNESYEDGRTTDTNYVNGVGIEAHFQGIVAEKAMALLFEEARVDRSISDTGDDGVDAILRLEEDGDAECYTVDIKSSSYKDAWLLCKRGYSHEEAERFVSAYVDADDGVVEFLGFATNEELIQEENLEESPSPYSDHLNYTLRECPHNMPEPNTERAWEHV